MRDRIDLVGLWLAAHLPNVHPNMRHVHHLAGFALGIVLIYWASFMAVHGEYFTESIATMPYVGFHIPRTVWDGFWFTIHAFGAVPFVAHADKLWHLWQNVDVERLEEAKRDGIHARLSEPESGGEVVAEADRAGN